MNITDQMQEDDFRQMLADHGETITWVQAGPTNTNLTALVSDGSPNRVPSTRGDEPLIAKTFELLIEDLPGGYDLQADRITYDGNTYKPQYFHTDPLDLLS